VVYSAVARLNLSLPHERRKARLQSLKLKLKVDLAERRERLNQVNAELTAMKPKPRTEEV